jgi:hypothetical protein
MQEGRQNLTRPRNFNPENQEGGCLEHNSDENCPLKNIPIEDKKRQKLERSVD